MADRKVDRLRCGGPSRDPDDAAPSEVALTVEYRAELDGLVRCCSLAELRAPETFETPSGLGPVAPDELSVRLPVGVPGYSGTVGGICGTSAISIMAPSGNVCDTGGAGGGGGTNDMAIGEGIAGGTVCCGDRRSFSMGVELATAAPGFRMGNSSSSNRFGIGMGPEMRPRTL